MDWVLLLFILYYSLSYVNNIQYFKYINNTSRSSLHCILIYILTLLCQLSNIDTNQFTMQISVLSSIIILQTAIIEHCKSIEEFSTFTFEIFNIIIMSLSLHLAAFSTKVYIIINTIIILASYIFVRLAILRHIVTGYHYCYHNICYHNNLPWEILYRAHTIDIHLLVTILINIFIAMIYIVNGTSDKFYMLLSNYVTILFIKMISIITMYKSEQLNQGEITTNTLFSLIFPNIMN